MRFTSIAAATAAILSVTGFAAPLTTEQPRLDTRSLGNLNNYDCKPADGKEPIIFLHGLGAPTVINWITKATVFANKGYCVFTPQYGTKLGFLGFASMRDSSKEIGGVVQKVLAATGAEKVNLVGHSMGTTVAAYYMKFDGGKDTVRNFVGFGANYKGTTLYGVDKLVRTIPGVSEVLRKVCASCDEFLPGSQFLADLNEGSVSVPGPAYTTIASKYDEIVLPYTSGLLYEEGVTDITIQDQCPLDLVGHLLQAVDPKVTAFIEWGLNGKQGNVPKCGLFGIREDAQE